MLLLTRDVRDRGVEGWDEELIDDRTEMFVEAFLATWPVPPGHIGEPADRGEDAQAWIELRDLVASGYVTPGTRVTSPSGRVAQVTPGGRLVLDDGREFDSPSAAGRYVRGSAANGWTFWRLEDGRRLKEVREAFRDATSGTPEASSGATIWEQLEQAALALDPPFGRAEIFSWFRRHYPMTNEGSLSAHIQVATSNGSHASSSFRNRRPLLTRLEHGKYTRFQD